MKILPSIFVVSLVSASCTHWGGEKLKSDWSALEQAEKLSCRDIPLKNEDLRVEKVHVLADLGPSLLVEVLSRRGVKVFYHLPFRSLGDLKEESLVALPVSQESVFLGAGISGSKPVYLLKVGNLGKANLQVRDLQNNAVINQYPLEAKHNWDLGPWTFSKGVLRALVREIKDEEALDDQPYLQLEVDTNSKTNSIIRAESTRRIIGQASLFVDSLSKTQILWLDRGTSEAVKAEASFEILPWKASPKTDSFAIDEKGRIESWAFVEAYDHSVLASVKGDSLLWENASISVQRLSKVTPYIKETQSSLPLSGVHVAQPLLAQGPRGTHLMLPQWLDHELTVAVYSVADKDVVKSGYAGIFKEGTSFHRAFFHEVSESFYLLSKGPGSTVGRFSLCQIDL